MVVIEYFPHIQIKATKVTFALLLLSSCMHTIFISHQTLHTQVVSQEGHCPLLHVYWFELLKRIFLTRCIMCVKKVQVCKFFGAIKILKQLDKSYCFQKFMKRGGATYYVVDRYKIFFVAFIQVPTYVHINIDRYILTQVFDPKILQSEIINQDPVIIPPDPVESKQPRLLTPRLES